MTGVGVENTLRLLFMEHKDMLSISDIVYHWLLLAEVLEMLESRSFVAAVVVIFDTVLLRLFFSFLSFLVSGPIVPNLFDPAPSTGPAKMARLEDKEVVAMRDVLVIPFCPLEITINGYVLLFDFILNQCTLLTQWIQH